MVEALLAGAQGDDAVAHVGGGEHAHLVGHGLVVHADAALADEAARLALALGEAGVGQGVGQRQAVAGQVRGRAQAGGDARGVAAGAEERRGRLLRLVGRGLAVQGRGDLPGQPPLGVADVGALQGRQLAHLVHGQQGVELEEALHVAVVHVDPVLEEVVGAGAPGVQPHGAGGGLAHLLAGGRGDEREGQAVHLLPVHAPGQVDAADDVAPLVVAAHLQAAAVVAVEDHEVVGLQDHVVELDEAHAVLQALLHRLAREHHVDAEVAADLAQEVQVAPVHQPVGVVEQQAVGGAVAEVHEVRELPLDAAQVLLDGLQGHHLAQLRLARRIAHHGGAAAGDADGPVPVPLQMHQAHDGHHGADVQGVRRGVEADVAGHALGGEQLGEGGLVGALLEEAALLHDGQEIGAGQQGCAHRGSSLKRRFRSLRGASPRARTISSASSQATTASATTPAAGTTQVSERT